MQLVGNASRKSYAALQQGLTLVELMVTLAVVAILLTVGVPNMASYWQQNRLTSATEAVYSQMTLLRSVALARNTQVYAKFGNTGGAAWCLALAEQNACDCADSTTTCSLTNMPVPRLSGADYPGITLTTNFGGNDTFVEMPRGTMDESGSVILTSQATGETARVVVSMLGRMRICSDDLSQYRGC